MGNYDKSPYKFYFTTITSASIEAIVTKGNGSREVAANIVLDYESHPRNTAIDTMGRFEFEGVGQGQHKFIIESINSTLGNRTDNFFVPAGEQVMKKEFDLFKMSQYTNASKVPRKDSSTPNPGFIGTHGTGQNI